MNVKLFDRVKETSATTGTGTYTLAGAVSSYVSFGSVLSDNDVVPYVATDAAGNYEWGLGTFTGPDQLARTTVIGSSNANAAVSWAAGAKEISLTLISRNAGMLTQRHNLTALVDPVAGTDHSGLGYGAGSVWVNAAGSRTFICVFANDSTSVWQVIGGGTTPKPTIKTANVQGGGAVGAGVAQRQDVVLSKLTADDTPTELELSGSEASYGKVALDVSSAIYVEGSVLAYDNATGDAKSWTVQATIARSGSGDPVLVDSDVTVVHASAGATAWDLAVGIDNTQDALTLTATGAAATDIVWSAALVVNGFSGL